LVTHETATGADGSNVKAEILLDGQPRTVEGSGNGPISALMAGLRTSLGMDVDVVDYCEHAVASGSEATAVAYVETRRADGTLKWGVGMHESITTASFRAVMSALHRQRKTPDEVTEG